MDELSRKASRPQAASPIKEVAGHRQDRRSPSTRCRSTAPPPMPPRMPMSPCGCGCCSSRAWRAKHKTTVYETLERPLVPVLADMEQRRRAGRSRVLARLSDEFAHKRREDRDARSTSSPASTSISARPSNWATSCSAAWACRAGARPQTGAWSTDSDVLEDLAAQGIELARKVLDWRQLSKLRSTYTDALPGFINPETGRVHTPMRWPRPRPGGSPRPIPICRTFRCAPRKAGASAPPSSRPRARS